MNHLVAVAASRRLVSYSGFTKVNQVTLPQPRKSGLVFTVPNRRRRPRRLLTSNTNSPNSKCKSKNNKLKKHPESSLEKSKPQQQPSSSDASGTTAKEINPEKHSQGDGFWIGTQLSRLMYAFGIIYVVSEYGIELTICEGPSMLPTIRPRGEIVLLDRFTPRLWGLQGGNVGHERARMARFNQRQHERQLFKQMHEKIQSKTKKDNRSGKSSLEGNRKKDTEGTKMSSSQQLQGSSSTTATIPITWYDPIMPVNELPKEGAWGRLWTRLCTGISVGDVVVVQHPDRIGTVCKRVLGLPGDIVTKPGLVATTLPSTRSNASSISNPKQQRRRRILQRRRSGTFFVVPDGHIWIEGDNPWNSSDSRNYGPVPASMIVGRVLLRVWPLRGSALMERGARPEDESSSSPSSQSFSGSLVLPAGYNDELIVRQFVKDSE